MTASKLVVAVLSGIPALQRDASCQSANTSPAIQLVVTASARAAPACGASATAHKTNAARRRQVSRLGTGVPPSYARDAEGRRGHECYRGRLGRQAGEDVV